MTARLSLSLRALSHVWCESALNPAKPVSRNRIILSPADLLIILSPADLLFSRVRLFQNRLSFLGIRFSFLKINELRH